jgi:hypothetical protein
MSAVGATITITVIAIGGLPIEGIPASDAWLIDCDPSGAMILCGGSGSSNADAASDTNGVMTMGGDITAGGCADGVTVVVQGVAIGCPATCLSSILIRSPDISGNLYVALEDFVYFKNHYNPNPYDKCCDYNCDGFVVLADFSTFALHYKHICS